MSGFRKYTREELVKFVRSMDRVIEEPTEILVIGGAAAALKYGATASTKDIDTWHAVPRAVAKAAADARAETGLPVPIEKAGVSDGPYHYEDRIQTVSMRLKKLRILVPERHDLALMKVVRGDRHDEDMIAEIHAHQPLKLDVLLKRFEEEMGPRHEGRQDPAHAVPRAGVSTVRLRGREARSREAKARRRRDARLDVPPARPSIAPSACGLHVSWSTSPRNVATSHSSSSSQLNSAWLSRYGANTKSGARPSTRSFRRSTVGSNSPRIGPR